MSTILYLLLGADNMNDKIAEKIMDYVKEYGLTSYRIENDDLKTCIWSLLHMMYMSNKFKYVVKKEIIRNIEKYQVAYKDTELHIEGYFTIDQLRDLHSIDDNIIFATM